LTGPNAIHFIIVIIIIKEQLRDPPKAFTKTKYAFRMTYG